MSRAFRRTAVGNRRVAGGVPPARIQPRPHLTLGHPERVAAPQSADTQSGAGPHLTNFLRAAPLPRLPHPGAFFALAWEARNLNRKRARTHSRFARCPVPQVRDPLFGGANPGGEHFSPPLSRALAVLIPLNRRARPFDGVLRPEGKMLRPRRLTPAANGVILRNASCHPPWLSVPSEVRP
jgi:hypothetical protein